MQQSRVTRELSLSYGCPYSLVALLKITLSESTWLIESGRHFRALHPDLDPARKWLENRWFDYRPVAGVLRAFRSEQVDVATGKVLQKTELKRVIVNPELPTALFDPPPGLQ